MSRGPALSAAFGSAALIFLLLAALVVFPLDKDVIVAPLQRVLAKSPASAPIDADGYKRETVLFPLLGGANFRLSNYKRSMSSRRKGENAQSGDTA